MRERKLNPFDVLMIAACAIGGAALLVLFGAAIIFFRLPGSNSLHQGFEGVRTWYHRAQEIKHEELSKGQPDEYFLQHAEVKQSPGAYEGYTLISMRSSTNVYLIDMMGHVAYSWSIPYNKAWPTPPAHIHPLAKARIFVERAEVLPTGDLIATYTGTGDTPYGYGLVKVDKDSNVLWTYSSNTHHNFYIDDTTGNIFVLTQRFIDRPANEDDGFDYPILADFVVELSQEGKVLSEVSVLDAFKRSRYLPMLHFLTRDEAKTAWGNENWDLLHTNSVAVLSSRLSPMFPLFKSGDILISMRRSSALAVIDSKTQSVIWTKQGSWRGQHSAEFLPNGHILLLDNLGYATKDQHYSRVLEIDPLSGEIKWSFDGSAEQPFYTEIFGFLQRLPNGNTLIAESNNARLIEISPSAKIVWSYQQANVAGANGNENAILAAPRYIHSQVPFLNVSPK